MITSVFFSKVLDINEYLAELKTGLKKISQWAYQGQVLFNHDANKHSNEVIFSHR